MAVYVVPQVLVFQEFNLVPQADRRDLPAFICGGHAFLSRCSESDEANSLGAYDHVDDTCYSWPAKPVGSVVDEGYTSLTIKNALLRYHHDVSSTLTKSDTNKIHSPDVNYIANPNLPLTYPRDASLLDRDVQIGDTVKVVGSNGSESVSLCTYVKDIEADQIAAVITNQGSDSDNTDALSEDSSATKTDGADNCITVSSTSAAAYDGVEDGNPTETYTVRVTRASTGGDATTARLRVFSASGNDDQSSVTPSAFGAATSIGTRGLTVTWDNDEDSDCSSAAAEDGAAVADFVVGQEWEIEVTQDFTPPTMLTTGSVYSGTDDKTYIITVTKGGTYGSSGPEITVSTDNGTDFSGPTIITAAGTSVSVGTKGLLAKFNQTALVKGDRYYIQVVASTDGPFRTLVLAHDLDADMALDDDTISLELSLYIKKDLEVGEDRTEAPPQVNWTQSNTEFCVKASIQGYDDSWTDGDVKQPLDVISEEDCDNVNQLCVTYRAWRSDTAVEVLTINDPADLDTMISGTLHPDNELKWAVFKALQNANGQDVKFMAVANPDDSAEWIKVLDKIEDRTDVYGLVPLTRDETILGLFQAHVSAQSTETAGRWRVLWLNLVDVPTKVVVSAANSKDEGIVLATTEDDSATSGTQYTIMRVAAGNAQFITNGVRPGDVARYQYTVDGFGNLTYGEYEIDAVLSEDRLRLVAGTGSAVNIPQKIEIWRNLTVSERAEQIGTDAGAWANRRVRAVWPDEITSGGTVMKGYHLCAALAALSSGVVPQQGLTHLELQGFDAVPRTVNLLNRTQLNLMAADGVWIVTQDDTGAVITRHAVTTGNSEDINQREEMVTRNLDSISFQFLDQFSPYIGKANAVPGMVDILEAEVLARIQFLRAANFTQRLGGQIVDATISDLRISPIFRDRIIVALAITLPYSLNIIECHLVV